MDQQEYIEQIDEQLRAYGFNRDEELSVKGSDSVFTRTVDARVPGRKYNEIIVIVQLEQYNVEAVESAIETTQLVHDVLNIKTGLRFASDRWYLLLVASEATKPMKIQAEQDAGKESVDNDAFLLPVIVDIDCEQVAFHNEPSTLGKTTTHGKMVSKVEKYFKL